MFSKGSHGVPKTPKVFPNKFPRATIGNVNIRVKAHYILLSMDVHV